MSDPLGLTADQRAWSNVALIMSGRTAEAWWPREPNPQVIDGEWTEACGFCRAITGHAPDCVAVFAKAVERVWS